MESGNLWSTNNSSDHSQVETSNTPLADVPQTGHFSGFGNMERSGMAAPFENRIFCGDCCDIVPRLPPGAIDLVCTSPVYANQRKNQYGGVSEADYPAWTVKWMAEVNRVLKPTGNVAIVIRPHVHNWELSDYVLRTRLALRAWGWIECDELIWMKPDGPALGNNVFPRRSWESILWFSKNRKPYCDPKANGRPSENIGQCGFSAKGQGNWVGGVKDRRISGIARCRDLIEIPVALNAKGNSHPAQYPAKLAEWIVRLLCPEFGVALDPFMGAGSTAEGVLRAGGERRYVGIDVNAQYCREAEARIEACIGDLLNGKEYSICPAVP